jgi:hypothetical protein
VRSDGVGCRLPRRDLRRGIGEKDKVAVFTSLQSARKAINISTKWNALLKAQGKPRNEDFEGECRKNLRVVECTTGSASSVKP